MFAQVQNFCFAILCLCIYKCNCKTYTPIVIWHGFGDTCCDDNKIGMLRKQLQGYLPGAHVVSLQIGNSTIDDFINSMSLHPDEQIRIACDIVNSDPLLANGYNAIGYSQGCQLLRGLAQRCPQPKMKNLITLAGFHQGIYALSPCDPTTSQHCENLSMFLNRVIYSSDIQEHFSLATFWHNPFNKTAYVQGSSFLADINNEKRLNTFYKANLQRLENFVMVRSDQDGSVIPDISGWFGYYKEGQIEEIELLQQSKLYRLDRLGLKKMDRQGKLHFLKNTWRHGQIEWEWFKDNIADRFLK